MMQHTTAFNPTRLRRQRANMSMRRLFQEHTFNMTDLVQPLFIVEGQGICREQPEESGLLQVSVDSLPRVVDTLLAHQIGGFMLYGVPSFKSEDGSALQQQMQALLQAVSWFKQHYQTTPIFADVCLCSYMSHGHCGLVADQYIKNDETVAVLANMAVLLAEHGVDFVSPSDMMDGRIRAIRQALDQACYTQVGIMSYAIKMASAFYGPFRHAAHSAPQFGDRQSYQMPVANRLHALRALAEDEHQGADVLLIKPALSNLDLLRDARERTLLPLAVYQVSGEYAMIRSAARQGMLDFHRAMQESLLSMKRAGADIIVSYYPYVWIKEGAKLVL